MSSSSTSSPGIRDVSSSPVYWYPRVSRAIGGCTLRFMKLKVNVRPSAGFSQHLDFHQQLGQLDTFLHCWLRVPPRSVLRLLPAWLRQLRVVVGVTSRMFCCANDINYIN
jgi:hypothetical protein